MMRQLVIKSLVGSCHINHETANDCYGLCSCGSFQFKDSHRNELWRSKCCNKCSTTLKSMSCTHHCPGLTKHKKLYRQTKKNFEKQFILAVVNSQIVQQEFGQFVYLHGFRKSSKSKLLKADTVHVLCFAIYCLRLNVFSSIGFEQNF